jgi:DNA-binding NarL/FixJ family response regulator
MRVLVADDHPLVRLGLETMLRSEPDMEIVGVAADGEEAVRLARLTRPDVIVLDAHMPVMDGLAALRALTQTPSAARCLILSGNHDEEQLLQAIKLGAAGYLVKDGSTDALLRAIRAIFHGGSVLAPVATQQLISAFQVRQTATRARDDLTPAELRVLRLLVRGSSDGRIAAELGLSTRTVSTHVRHILDKLAVKNRVQAALYAREHGLAA